MSIITAHDSDSVALALADAPVDSRTGNKVLYAASWKATKNSMIGERNEDWVRREIDWFNKASNKLSDMEGPVPALFQACAGDKGEVNSAYGHIIYSEDPAVMAMEDILDKTQSLYSRMLSAIATEGLHTRHAVIIISDRDVHAMAVDEGKNDFICTNALNIMIDDDNRVHIIAQMRSMDAVFGYRADYSMWDSLMDRLVDDLAALRVEGIVDQHPVVRGDIFFQVANLHVYPRHFDLLREWADKIYDEQERHMRSVWAGNTTKEA